jgi:DNA invertase Pin-like site-specific DNA recombinase
MTAAIYARKSTEQNGTADEQKSIARQVEHFHQYLEDRERTLDGPTDKIVLSLTAFADELEREKARLRVTDAMCRKARAGHVCGGQPFGYENVQVLGSDGQRSHVARRIVESEARSFAAFSNCARLVTA